eukprot:g12474.t1
MDIGILDGDNAAHAVPIPLHQQQKIPSTAVAAAPQQAVEEEGGTGGVLLYYKYVHLGEERRSTVKDWYLQRCGVEGLRGRVRVALDGVNCTLGGSLAALRRHIDGVKADTILRGEDIDFKLSASRGARNSQAALESGFTTLSVKAVKEVVSLGVRGAGLSHLQGGRHVSPREFHRLLKEETARRRQRAATHRIGGGGSVGAESVGEPTANAAAAATVAGRMRSDSGSPPLTSVAQADDLPRRPPEQHAGQAMPPEGALLLSESCGGAGAGPKMVDTKDGDFDGREGDVGEAGSTGASGSPPSTLSNEKEAVLLDVRNVYETSIGHFSAEGVERLDPKTRQFSELPKWVDENVDRLRGKRVLMYCTGGVRCEMASALIRRHCDAESTGTEVLQLSGGIERYLQAYPSNRQDTLGGKEGGRERGAGDDGNLSEGRGGQAPRKGAAGDGASGGGAHEEGFFRGKNFVFDERVSVPESPAGGMAIGRCLVCESPWDDYGSRSRCARCRMLVLVCDACVMLLAGGGDGTAEGGRGRRKQAVDRAAQLPITDPREDEATAPARGTPQTSPQSPALAAEESAAGAGAAAPLPSGDRGGRLGVDRGKGNEEPNATSELVCPACRLRG